jgi:hypothetical protein
MLKFFWQILFGKAGWGLLLLLFTLPISKAQQPDLQHRSLNLGLCKSLTTSPKPHQQWRHSFSLSLISTEAGGIRGVGLAPAYQYYTQEADGLLLTGGLTRSGGGIRGLSISGLGHYSQGRIQGCNSEAWPWRPGRV